jgi:hypothetical protein
MGAFFGFFVMILILHSFTSIERGSGAFDDFDPF